MTCLPESFYRDEATLVARRLLGQRLVRNLDGKRTGGLIVETEAYLGEEDLACHAHVGKTKRNAMLYDQAGKAYVYFTYGMHWLVNAVTGETDFPAAVLIRAILPQEGLDGIQARRKDRPQAEWCNGPAKICQALSIDGALNGIRLYEDNGELWIEKGRTVADEVVTNAPRVGLGSTPEPWKSIPWRFMVDPNYLMEK